MLKKRFSFLLLFLTIPLFSFATPSGKEIQNDLNQGKIDPLTKTPFQVSKVDPISGCYIEEEMDLLIAGSESLSFRRSYFHQSPVEKRYGLWHYNLESFMACNFDWDGQQKLLVIGDESGRILSFHKNNSRFVYDLSQNIPQASEGKNHPLNIHVTYQKEGDKNCLYKGVVTDGSGAQKKFTTVNFQWNEQKTVKAIYEIENPIRRRIDKVKGTLHILPQNWIPYQAMVTEQRQPNGNIIEYSYETWKNEEICPKFRLLSSITAYNSSKTKILATLKFQYQKHDETIDRVIVTGSDGRSVTLMHHNNGLSTLKRVDAKWLPSFSYIYNKNGIEKVERPEGRCLKTEYDAKNRVKAQWAPIGPSGEMQKLSHYVYHDKATEVYDAEENKTIWRYDDKKTVTSLEKYCGTKLYSRTRYEKDLKTGNLLSEVLEDGSGNLILKKSFAYDDNHNPIKETIDDGKESHTIYRTFSNDGFNLKLSESDQKNRIVRYSYVPNTNLLVSELTYEDHLIRKRIFHTYDDCAILIKTIIDDGQSLDSADLKGVTFRKITEIKPKQQMPCFGLPEIVEEKTINNQRQEVLLHKVIYTYTSFGKILLFDF